MQFTPYHAKYFAHELNQRIASKVGQPDFDDAQNLEKITSSLSDAQVDLNPHQVDAALFALRSPLSQGVILADEVGLGKTIEAGIVISQRWAERRRRILIIAPANLRKQWSQELADKFFLPSTILEKKSFDALTQQQDNPFEQPEKIVLCSFQFASSKAGYVRRTDWDLVVIDEAHRLRNVYRKENKIANTLKDALAGRFKILLTATPLQNSLLELYGLISLVDDYIFGDLRSFRQQYARITDEAQFVELKTRIAPVCKRTLREQVREYVRYTERLCITHGFDSADDEHDLYQKVSEYLRKPKLYALPASQRALMTLILRKLLASSTFAIAQTLLGLANKLEAILQRQTSESCDLNAEPWAQDFEAADTLQDEWADDPDLVDEAATEPPEKNFSPRELAEIKEEMEEIRGFYELAKGIEQNSKGTNLTIALDKGFEKMRALGAAEKAVIFTESVRTQQYIREILEKSGYEGKIVLFNGSNNDPESSRIYHGWLAKNKGSDRITGTRAADIRAALVEHFRDEAQILIATEAAAEGINLQFCSMVVNYDMPWNPQRIEQRVGRCHRYGQRFNVVVVNFVNERNAADVRVYTLLQEKFKLFDGVFGASDEVLGAIESGIDFEKRIVQIYQNCPTEAEINAEFDRLRSDMEASIAQRMDHTHQQLLENFDEEVLEKIKVESEKKLDAFEQKFWKFSCYALAKIADQFDEANHSFRLFQSPLPSIPNGNFRFLSHRLPFDRLPKDSQVYRYGHPLSAHLFEQYKEKALPRAQVTFDLRHEDSARVSALQNLAGCAGWLRLDKITLQSVETEDYLVFSGLTDAGQPLSEDQCRRMFSLVAAAQPLAPDCAAPEQSLEVQLQQHKSTLLHNATLRNAKYFDLESDKLDQWGDDRRSSLKITLRDLDEAIKTLKKQARNAPNLPEKLALEKERQRSESERDKAWREYDAAAKSIEAQKDKLIAEIEQKLQHTTTETNLFFIRWILQ